MSARGDRQSAATAGPANPLPVPPLTRASIGVRMVSVVCVVAALGYGAYRNTDDLFPVGPLAQFATSPDPNGRIRSAYIEADTDDGRRVRVPLNATGTGIGRAEVEGQIGRFEADPSLLQTIADAYEQRHPDGDNYVRLYLMRKVTQMKDAQPVGEPVVTVLAEWQVTR